MDKYPEKNNKELARITKLEAIATPRKMWYAKKYAHKLQKQKEQNFKLKKEKKL